MIFCFVRETKQLTLEELDRKSHLTTLPLPPPIHMLTLPKEVFSVPTKKFISHELNVMVPYFLKRHVLRRDIQKPPAIIASEDSVDAALK